MNGVRVTIEKGRRIIGGPEAPVFFGYVQPGRYESDDLGDPEGEPFRYRLERLGRCLSDEREETGWYLSGGAHLREWCAADVVAAVGAANVHIVNGHL